MSLSFFDTPYRVEVYSVKPDGRRRESTWYVGRSLLRPSIEKQRREIAQTFGTSPLLHEAGVTLTTTLTNESQTANFREMQIVLDDKDEITLLPLPEASDNGEQSLVS